MSRITYRASAVATCAMLSAGVALAQSSDITKPYQLPKSSPTLNFYGLPGTIDTPAATPMRDGTLAATVSYFGGQTRTTVSYQFSRRLSASFRYTGIQDFDDFGFSTFRDRNFDLRFMLFDEGRYRPAVTVGLQDLAGTGIYAGEYVVATKTLDQPFRLPGRVRVSAGLGWGRLGSSGAIGSPFGSDRPVFTAGDTGGEPSVDQWFRGSVAPFAGIEWQVNDRLGLKAEYSSDAYQPETSRGVFTRNSRLNFGLEYQLNKRFRLGAYYLYGSELGVSLQLQANPRNSIDALSTGGPRQIIRRPDRKTSPEAWDPGWAASSQAPVAVRNALAPAMRDDGLTLLALEVSANIIEVRFSNQRYKNMSIAIGRAARILSQAMPATVEIFRLTPVLNGLPLSTVTIRRSELERLEFEPDAATLLYAGAAFEDAPPRLDNGLAADDVYPRFSWTIGPYVSPSYFDPDRPVRADVGLSAQLNYRLAPGWLIGAEVRSRVTGNIADGRLSNSVLPRVRTNNVLYARATGTSLRNLFVAKQWKPGKNTYARVTAGYLESMFGGVSTEFLWKPESSRLALGVEANYVRQRDFDQRFGFQDYDVLTGHVSAYYELGDGYLAQVDAGRYLAGDVGATFTLEREFKNGWRVGGFFTLTDVSAADFGEGSFDKGIKLSIPLSWFTGKPSRTVASTTIRPIQRDGGARLNVPGRLYEQVRTGHRSEIAGSWARVWE